MKKDLIKKILTWVCIFSVVFETAGTGSVSFAVGTDEEINSAENTEIENSEEENVNLSAESSETDESGEKEIYSSDEIKNFELNESDTDTQNTVEDISGEEIIDSDDEENSTDEQEEVSFTYLYIYDTEIYPIENNGIYYFMIPNADIKQETAEIYYTGNIFAVNNAIINQEAKTITVSTNSGTEVTAFDMTGQEYQICILSSSLPSLNISLSSCTLEVLNSGSKDTKYSDNHIELTGTDGEDITSDSVEIKGRGNSSWKLEKKPYQIKFEKRTDLLGMGKAKKWVLLANHDDASLLRNAVSFSVAQELGMEETPECRYIDLWIDGNYLGNYLLAQKVDINSISVDLQNEDGVLAELDNVYYADENQWFYSGTSNSHFVLKEHNADTDEEGTVAFNDFQEYVTSFEEALYSTNKDWSVISEYIDEEFFAEYYLLQELTENWDAMAGSTYMYRDGAEDEIHMGPIWDMGLSLGNQQYQDISQLWVNGSSTVRHRTDVNTWYQELVKIPEFNQLVKNIYYSYVRTSFVNSLDTISSIETEIQESANMNFIRWNILGEKNLVWVGNPYPENYEDACNEVASWISERVDVLDGLLGVPSISYSTHIQNIGWQSAVSDGESSGTTGQSLRLEGVRISLSNQLNTGDIEYATHVQNIGWQGYVSNGEMSGTSGQSLRLEAIKIRLTGEMAENYDVYYRVHAQNVGWMGWAKNGEEAGTSGYSYRLKAIQIQLVPKGEAAPGSTDNAYLNKQISYSTHVENVGWQNEMCDGATSGTSGRSLRLEAIKINLVNPEYSGSIEYSTHVQNIGWQGYVSNGRVSGTNGQSLRLEAIKIRLTGEMAKHYDIYYRVHAQNYGWMGWAKNGESAGTSGQSLRLEAIQIVLVPKGESAPGSTTGAFSEK